MSGYAGDPHDDAMEEADEGRPRLRSTVAAPPAAERKQKGRGFVERRDGTEEGRRATGRFESLEPAGTGPAGVAKSVEGWVLFITGVHEEAQEEDVTEAFSEFGDVKNVYLNLDRQTGFVKGYALVEYANRDEAENAIAQMDGQELLTQPVRVQWAFSSVPVRRAGARAANRDRAGGDRNGDRQRR